MSDTLSTQVNPTVSTEAAPTAVAREPLLRVRHLVKRFPITTGIIFQKTIGHVHAVEDVSFDVYPGETLGLVGESGCGKTTTGRCILQLHRATSGSITLEGVELTKLKGESLRVMRRDMQIIFQDPYASLNPRKTVERIIIEPLAIHGLEGHSEGRKARVRELLNVVGLGSQFAKRYPRELSGGQRQRVGLARSLALNPKLIICDEPVSALDVSIQAQILNLLAELQEEFGLTYIFIAHDLSVVKHISDRVAVMYLGHIVELAGSKELFLNPIHPYTFALMSAIPIPDPELEETRVRQVLEGDVPSPASPPPGCPFHPRCSRAQTICSESMPELLDRGDSHFCACYFPLGG